MIFTILVDKQISLQKSYDLMTNVNPICGIDLDIVGVYRA
jgi:hypothetical protein